MPRAITPSDGIPIADWLKEYVFLWWDGEVLTLYVEKRHEANPGVRSIERALANRRDRYPEVRKEVVPLDKITALRSGSETGTTDTVSIQRRTIQLLRDCHHHRSTDVQLKQSQDAAGVRVRIDGDMTTMGPPHTKTDQAALCETLWNMADPSSRQGNYSPEVCASASIVHNLSKYGLDHYFVAVRLQFNPTFLGPECEIRLQPVGQTAKSLDSIGLPAPAINSIRRATAVRGGVAIVSGPVGSGKTNLLASIVHDYSRRFPGKKIQTIEDPVEIFIGNDVSQMSVSGAFGDRTEEYEEFFNAVLRSDCQLVMLQECRDAASGIAFFRLAITGAVAVSTIHTPTPMKIIPRLADWNISEVLLTDPEVMRLLGGVHLIPVLCEHCRIPLDRALKEKTLASPYLPTVMARLQRHADYAYRLRGHQPPALLSGYTRNPNGCDVCRGSATIRKPAYGVAGRRQVAEMIIPDATLLEHLYKGRLPAAHHHLRSVLKIPSIQENALDLVAAGVVCPCDVEHYLGEFPDRSPVIAQIAAGGTP